MGTAEKLLILLLLDMAALLCFVIRLMRLGNTYSKAMQIVWEWVVFKPGFDDARSFAKTDWVMAYRVFWWFINFLSVTLWVLTQRMLTLFIVLFLFFLHVYGYLHYKKVSLQTLERFVYINGNWGIIYLSIHNDSLLKGKSLAELDLRKKNLLVLAVERNEEVQAFPKGIEVLEEGDRIVIFGDLNSYRSTCR